MPSSLCLRTTLRLNELFPYFPPYYIVFELTVIYPFSSVIPAPSAYQRISFRGAVPEHMLAENLPYLLIVEVAVSDRRMVQYLDCRKSGSRAHSGATRCQHYYVVCVCFDISSIRRS
jgi:hypothetical protein